MKCPKCKTRSDCVDSRYRGETRWRKYDCPQCQHRFFTEETYGEPIFQTQKVFAELRRIRVLGAELKGIADKAERSLSRIAGKGK